MLINPYVFASYTPTDADAALYIASVETADGQTLENPIRQAVDTYVQSLKANNIWNSVAQLLLPCGPRTLAGALRPLKGNAPTNINFVSGDYNRKNGLGDTANSTKYLNSNVAMNTIPASSNGLFAYGSIASTSGDRSPLGWYGGSSGTTNIFVLDEWAAYISGRAFRSGTVISGQVPVSTATTAATCMIGSRTALNSAALYIDGTTITNSATVSPSLNSTQRIYYFGINSNNSPGNWSRAILKALGIFTSGLNATQAAALRTVTATYVAAVAAAIP